MAKNEISNALNDLMGNKTPIKKTNNEKLKSLNEKSRVIGIRFPLEDIKKLKKHFKLKHGSICLSAEIRKIIYSYMEHEDIL